MSGSTDTNEKALKSMMKIESLGMFLHSVLAQPAAGYSRDVILNVDCAGLLVQLS